MYITIEKIEKEMTTRYLLLTDSPPEGRKDMGRVTNLISKPSDFHSHPWTLRKGEGRTFRRTTRI